MGAVGITFLVLCFILTIFSLFVGMAALGGFQKMSETLKLQNEFIEWHINQHNERIETLEKRASFKVIK